MNHFRYWAPFFFFPALFLLPLPREIHPYIDPGTGSLVLQAALGALVAILVAVKMFWNQIMAFFRRLSHTGRKHREHEESGD